MRLDAPAAARPARLPVIDAARGVAIVAMVIYHLSWDLGFFGFVAVDVTQALGWRIFARLIAGTFLFLVGVSLVLSTRNGFNRARFFRRLGIVTAAALAITAVTFFAMRDTFIFFGILHCIALSSVLGLAFVRAPLALVIAAAILSFLARPLLAAPLFDHPALLWLGLYVTPPRSNDYVPLFPWFGVVLAGIAAARLVPRLWPQGMRLPELSGRLARALVWAGRQSLAIYLIHQPMLLALVYLAAQISPPNLLAFEGSYLQSCSASCVNPADDPGLCGRACACIADRVQSEGFWRPLMLNELSQEQTTRYFAIAEQCRVSQAE
jgi:uncharacterized membrane protein